MIDKYICWIRGFLFILVILAISSCDYNFEGVNYFQVYNNSKYTINYVLVDDKIICTNLEPNEKSEKIVFDESERSYEISINNTDIFMGKQPGENCMFFGNIFYTGNRQNERYLILYNTNIAVSPNPLSW